MVIPLASAKLSSKCEPSNIDFKITPLTLWKLAAVVGDIGCFAFLGCTHGICRSCSLVFFRFTWPQPILKCYSRQIKSHHWQLDSIPCDEPCDGVCYGSVVPICQYDTCSEASLIARHNIYTALLPSEIFMIRMFRNNIGIIDLSVYLYLFTHGCHLFVSLRNLMLPCGSLFRNGDNTRENVTINAPRLTKKRR
jgi:hypothetical protein